jgi:hypothetical protein
MTLSIDIQHNSVECHYVECHYAESRDYLNVMLSVIMLSVVAPLNIFYYREILLTFIEFHKIL